MSKPVVAQRKLALRALRATWWDCVPRSVPQVRAHLYDRQRYPVCGAPALRGDPNPKEPIMHCKICLSTLKKAQRVAKVER